MPAGRQPPQPPAVTVPSCLLPLLHLHLLLRPHQLLHQLLHLHLHPHQLLLLPR